MYVCLCAGVYRRVCVYQEDEGMFLFTTKSFIYKIFLLLILFDNWDYYHRIRFHPDVAYQSVAHENSMKRCFAAF